MVGVVLVVSGLIAAVYGTWRGYAAARSALIPLVRDGDPTRNLIEMSRPVHARVRLRLAARQALVSVLWLCIAMYGLYLVTVSVGAGA